VNFTDGLNPDQAQAVTTTDGAVLVLAGPGSGKTRVLTHRIAYLLAEKEVPPYHITAMTFTNKAANEMQERVGNLTAGESRVWLGTFHSFCVRVLRRESEATPYQSNFTIYDSGEQRTVIKNIIKDMNLNVKQYNPYRILGKISKYKNEMLLPHMVNPIGYQDELIANIYAEYQERLLSSNVMDFDDLLMQTVLLFRNNTSVLDYYHDKLQYIMVDEFQDTNIAQYEIIHHLGQGSGNIFVVGDPDQSIYAFRGADYRNIQRYLDDYPDHTLITLDENYRSHQLILDAAMAVIRHNDDHIKRDLFTQRKKGAKIQVAEHDNGDHEGDWVGQVIKQLRLEEGYSLRDFAVMYRTNAQSLIMENRLRDHEIPHKIVGGIKFYDRAEIKDLLAYLHVINNPNDRLRLERIINKPTRGIGRKTIDTLFNWAEKQEYGLWASLQAVQQGVQSPLTNRATKSVSAFVAMLNRWIDAKDTQSIAQLLDQVIADVGYMQFVQQSGTDDEIITRTENITELRRELAERQSQSLQQYLEENLLASDLDNADTDDNSVTLMTLHAAKGLEFPVVFLVGVEDGRLPHSRSKESPQELAEERRLMYVGITRAKERLYISHVNHRYNPSFRNYDYCSPSEFLYDLPQEIISIRGKTLLRTNPRRSTSRSGQGFRQKPFPTKTIKPWQSPTPSTRNAPKPPKEPAPPIESGLVVGDAIYHAKYGVGTVLSINTDFDFVEAEVRFAEDGVIKKFDASFLRKMD